MFNLILHNILKHKFLFILIGLMIILLCLYLVVGMNTVFSVTASLQKAVSENMSGDIIITSAKMKHIDLITKDGEKEVVPLEDWETLLKFVRSRPEVMDASPRLRVWGFTRSELNEMPMILTGVDPLSEPDLLPGRILSEGEWISGQNEIQLYYRHSDYLSASLNDILGITVVTDDGYPNYDNVKLVGIFDYKDLSYYSEFAYYGFISLDYLNELIMYQNKTASEIFVRMKDKNKLSLLKDEINKKFPKKYQFVMPQESSNLVSGVYNLTFFTVYFVAFLLMIMVYLCSSFLINLTIETRRQEIGIYQALGVQKWRIGMLFGGEFFIVMILSGIIGILIGLYVMSGISTNGIQASIIPLKLVFGRSILFIQNDPKSFLIIGGILFLAFFVSTLSAIIKLSRLNPVEIMQEL